MYKELVPLSRDAQKSVRVKPITNFDFAKDTHLAGIFAAEFGKASSIYPIVFVEAGHNGFRPAALIGLEPGTNAFVSSEGKWAASYIPAMIRRYPFALAPIGDENQMAVCLDMKSDFVSTDEGEPLFEESGEPTKLLKSAKEYLLSVRKMEAQTDAFCEMLKTNNLLSPLNLSIRGSTSTKQLKGCFTINEDRLNRLDDELFLTLRSKGYVAPIYAHLISLNQIENLLKLVESRTSPAEGSDTQSTEMH